MTKDEKFKRLQELEEQMMAPEFWNDKVKAQATLKEINTLKDDIKGVEKYNKGDAIITIFSGAGGDDAEDFSSMLFDMYSKYIYRHGWGHYLLNKNENDHGGFRNITFEVNGKDAYGILKNESGVHRLVRISPFNAKGLRHTSFSLVEVVPKFEGMTQIHIPESDLEIQYSKSGGPGGQNVNKRETAVRLIHKPTNMSVHVDSERSQAQNKEKAMALLRGKLYKRQEEEARKRERGLAISKTVDIEWGNQIRSYVLHPYKMIKDHRTDVETSDIEKVLDGYLEDFIEAEKNLE